MSNRDVLIPLTERSVVFYGGELLGVVVNLGGEHRIFVPVKPISDHLGLSWAGQLERIKRDEVLSESVELIRVTRINSSQRGNPTAQCLPLELLPGFLFGIDTARVKDKAIADQVILFRREAYRVLWDAFKGDLLQAINTVAPAPTIDLVSHGGASGAELAYQLPRR